MGETMKGKTLLKGHALLYEGAAYDDRGKPMRYDTGIGRAKCECGEMSDQLPSRNQRKDWHRAHKDAIRAQIGSQS